MTTFISSSNNGINLDSGSYSNPIVIDQGVALTGDFNGYPIYANSGSWNITNDGLLASSDGGGSGIHLGGGGTVTNQSNGVIASLLSTATGIYVEGGTGIVTNQGTINAGVWLQAGGAVTNAIGARIVSDSTSGGYGVGLHLGGTVINAGLISGLLVGIDATADGGSVTNQAEGTLTGTYAGVLMGFPSQTAGGGGTLINQSGGTIIGDSGVIGGGTSGTVNNTGVITGTFAGTISHTGITLVVGAGVSLNAGGSVINQFGGSIIGASYGVYISNGAGTVINSGSIMGIGGSGVELTDGGLVSNATTGTISATLHNGVVITGAAGTVANAGAIIDLGTAHAAVALDKGGYLNNSGTISSNTHPGVYTTGGAMTVINTGKIGAAAAVGIDLVSGGSITNQANGTISGGSSSTGISIIGGAGTLTNYGMLINGINLHSGGAVTNQGGGTISSTGVAVYGATASVAIMVSNAGRILGGTSGSGVVLRSGGSITNSATGMITGGDFGAAINGGAGIVVNAGSIAATGTAGFGIDLTSGGSVTNTASAAISGGNFGVLITSGAGTVVNDGSISGAAGQGVDIEFGGSVTNAASASVTGVGGVRVLGASGAVVNDGTIEGTGASRFGVAVYDGGTLTNAGTIISISGMAVYFAAGFANHLVIDPGAVFNGFVDSGNTIGATAVSTMELASGTSSGTLTGLDSKYIDFAQITVDSGASWFLTGANTIVAGATLTELSGASLTDTGTLVNNGVIVLDPSTMTVAALTGTGSVMIDTGSTLDVQGTIASDETIDFAGSGAYLHLDNPNSVNGSVTDFVADETIDLKGINPASVSYSGGLLSFTGGSFALSLASAGTVTHSASGDGTEITVQTSAAANGTWATDAPGNFDVSTNWTGDAVPGPITNATIDFPDDPQVLHDTSDDTLNSLTNTAGDFVMAGGTLTATLLENDSLMSWTGGSIVLIGTTASLTNAASLMIAANGQSLTATGIASVSNTGTILVSGGNSAANIDAPLTNTGMVIVNQGTLSLNGGGSSNGSGLQGGVGGLLQFGLPAGGIGNTFSITGGEYAVGNTSIDGGTLDVSAASSIFFVNSLRLAGAGSLLLGAQNAIAQNGFLQGPTAWAGATGIPFLSGSDTLTVFGGGSLLDGVESGSGLTRLIGTNLLGGTIQLDGGRTVENDGWMNWSSGNIVLGAGDTSAANQSGTITNVLGATFYITADGDIGNQGVETSQFNNAGVTAVFAGVGETDIDAYVDNTGYIQAQTGTLSLNGGGSSAGASLYVANDAVLQFGTMEGGAAGGTFSITTGRYTAGFTAITGGTLDVSAASGAVFVDQLAVTAGALQLGELSDAVVQGDLLQTGGLLEGGGVFTVFGGASLMGGVQSGPAITRLYGTNLLGGSFQLDGGRTVENDGWMNWSSGNIELGSGDASAVSQTGTITNVSGAVFYVTSDGQIDASGADGGTLNNSGVLAVFAGVGETDIDAYLNDTGGIQAQSGVLGLNGGGTANAGNLYVASNAVVQFGTMAATGTGGTFVFDGGPYIASNTVVNGSTVDLSAVSGVSFGNSLTLASGSLLLGSNFPSTANFVQSGGVLSGSGYFYVTASAALSGGLETGSGRTVLEAGGSISGPVAFDGGYSVENQGALTWTGGSITLGGGDPNTTTHVATLINDAGSVFDIETSGTINSAGFSGTGAINNAGTIVSGGLGTTAVYSNLFNNGVVEATAGTMALEQGVGGTGTFLLDGSATLDFVNGAATSNTMQFLQPGGTLEVDSSGQFGPTISGFAAGDVIDAGSVGFVTGTTTVGFNAGTLTVSEGSESASFTLSGSYVADEFQIIGSDGHGGTEVGYG